MKFILAKILILGHFFKLRRAYENKMEQIERHIKLEKSEVYLLFF